MSFDDYLPKDPVTPNSWFMKRFPAEVARYGEPFVEREMTALTMTQVKVYHMNTDTMGAILGGERRLRHQTVFNPSDETFYFWDPEFEAFCPTTEGKLRLLASNFLLKCANACDRHVDIAPLLGPYRDQRALKIIVDKARVILRADKSFFEGEAGKPRYIDGRRVNPQDEPAHRVFVREALQRHPDAILSLSDCYASYVQFCLAQTLPILDKVPFRNAIVHEIRNLRGCDAQGSF